MKEFSVFLCMGKCKGLGSMKLFLWYAHQLSGANILGFFILSVLKDGCRSWLLNGGHPVSALRSLRAHCAGGCNVIVRWLQHPLLKIMFSYRKHIETSVCVLRRFSPVRLFVTLRTIALQAPLSMRFSREEYWSGLPCSPPAGHRGAFKHPLFRIILSWVKTYREKNYE